MLHMNKPKNNSERQKQDKNQYVLYDMLYRNPRNLQ